MASPEGDSSTRLSSDEEALLALLFSVNLRSWAERSAYLGEERFSFSRVFPWPKANGIPSCWESEGLSEGEKLLLMSVMFWHSRPGRLAFLGKEIVASSSNVLERSQAASGSWWESSSKSSEKTLSSLFPSSVKKLHFSWVGESFAFLGKEPALSSSAFSSSKTSGSCWRLFF